MNDAHELSIMCYCIMRKIITDVMRMNEQQYHQPCAAVIINHAQHHRISCRHTGAQKKSMVALISGSTGFIELRLSLHMLSRKDHFLNASVYS